MSFVIWKQVDAVARDTAVCQTLLAVGSISPYHVLTYALLIVTTYIVAYYGAHLICMAAPFYRNRTMHVASRYNWCVTHRDRVYLYNGLSSSIIMLDTDDISEGALDALTTESSSIPAELDDSTLSTLVENGFVVDEGFDERDLLSFLYEQKKKPISSHAGITAVVTEQCNFNCSYCYQKNGLNSKKMKSECVKALPDFALRLLDASESPGLNLTLFGGEPLLEMDICYTLLESIGSAVRERGKIFASALVTNGYLLDKKKCENLSKLGVQTIQVTVDSNQANHDCTRALGARAEPTFARIMENVRVAKEYLHVLIRVNVSSDKSKDIDSELRSFSMDNNAHMYAHPVSLNHLDDMQTYFDNLAVINQSTALRPYSRGRIKPYPVVITCQATNPYSFLVDTNGMLKKCWNQLFDAMDFGNVYGGDDEFKLHRNMKWLNYNPYRKEHICYDCKMLPSCGASCAYYGLNNLQRCLYNDHKEYERHLCDHIDYVEKCNNRHEQANT
jgi:uncharacterized protein